MLQIALFSTLSEITDCKPVASRISNAAQMALGLHFGFEAIWAAFSMELTE
jgi:hypothetical protein